MWQKILKIRGLARQFCRVEVHNGVNTSFWYDQWSSLGCLMDMCGPRGQIDTRIRQHNTVHMALTKIRRRNHRVEGLINIEQQLQSIPQSDAGDVVLWKGKQDVYKAQFFTRDTWNNIRNTREVVAWHKGIWFIHATPKHRLCTLLAIRNRLTGDRMVVWNTWFDANCVLRSQ